MIIWAALVLGLLITWAVYLHSQDRTRDSDNTQAVLREIRDALKK